jgi:hypothetical protein
MTAGTSASKVRTERCAPRDPRCTAKVSRWRVRWVDATGAERTKSFQRKPDAQAYLNGLTADVQRGEYVDPRKSAETFGSVAEQWFTTNSIGSRKPLQDIDRYSTRWCCPSGNTSR